MKICKDCRYYGVNIISSKLSCMHPKVAVTDLVTGHTIGPECSKRRAPKGGCGKEGKDFQRKKTKISPKPEPKKTNWLWDFLSQPPIGMPSGPKHWK